MPLAVIREPFDDPDWLESRIRLVEGVEGRGVDFFRVECAHDLDGIVAKWKGGSYTSGPRTSWLIDPKS